MTTRQRYDMCDDTCTTDCGHCKGQGRPQVPSLSERLRSLGSDITPEMEAMADRGEWRALWVNLRTDIRAAHDALAAHDRVVKAQALRDAIAESVPVIVEASGIRGRAVIDVDLLFAAIALEGGASS